MVAWEVGVVVCGGEVLGNFLAAFAGVCLGGSSMLFLFLVASFGDEEVERPYWVSSGEMGGLVTMPVNFASTESEISLTSRRKKKGKKEM